GPDYKKDYLPRVQQHTSYVGQLPPTLERSGDVGYLWRPASCGGLPAQYKQAYVGAIGWGIPECDFINKTRRESGFHIKNKEQRRAVLDAISHRYQNPWIVEYAFSSVESSCVSSEAFSCWNGLHIVYLLLQSPLSFGPNTQGEQYQQLSV
ncbi:hypothetical protein MDA_GLEAN10004992, partial [Myotis davidii]